MEIVQLFVSVITVLIAGASFIIARRSDIRTKKAEDVKNLLGERETIAYAALKLLRDGLPDEHKERRLVLDALMQACIFESPDRARALLYRVIELNLEAYKSEIQEALQTIRDTFNSMDRYQFPKEELDLDRGRRRVSAVDKVINTPEIPKPKKLTSELSEKSKPV